MKLAHVFIEHSTMHLDRTFSYGCDGFTVCRGMRVVVPFGAKEIVGFVERVEEISAQEAAAYDFEIKRIIRVLDEEPLLNEELFELANMMAKRYIVPRIACFQCILPAKLKPRSTAKCRKLETWVRYEKDIASLTKKQQVVLEAMKEAKEMLRTTYYQMYKSVGKKLISLGCVTVFEREAQAVLGCEEPSGPVFDLNAQQQHAVDAVLHHSAMVTLLHGVTGSGKTEVFLHLAKAMRKRDKQVLILVPEISLTPQMIARVKQRFGAQVAIYHSALNEQEKYEQYQLVKKHQVDIVVGTRSAVFMPFDHLGLIVMDEEHDTSYKQDRGVRYHCRDIALQRAKIHQAKLVLASATPSLESYARAHKGIYQLVEMPKRINEQFPQVKLVEMREAVKKKESYLMSNALLDAIYTRLQRKEQVILLLNRRGYTPILRCMECGYVQMCANCETAMSYHKEEGVLKCHICDSVMPVPTHCPSCHSAAWRYMGMGTQKLEEFIQIKFPQAKIIRMDADTTHKKHAHENYLRDFGKHKADILLGTQMIAKGLDFENVTLVGILNGDALLNRSDYRSAELCYDLLEQACGRSGRGEKQGEVIIQAYDTKHYAIQCAAHHDYKTFFKNEMNYRHLAGYPPYTYLTSLTFSHKQEELAYQGAQLAFSLLKAKSEVRVLGPTALHKLRGECRIRILLKGKQEELLTVYAKDVYEQHLYKKQKARLDIDLSPLYLD